MTDPVYGYIQIGRVAGQLDAIKARMEEIAAIYHTNITNRIYYEVPPPTARLRSLIDQTAIRYDQNLPAMLSATAQHLRVDLHGILSAPAPSVALWKLIAAARTSASCKILVPSPAHFDGFGIGPDTVWHLLSAIGAQVLWLGADIGLRPRDQTVPRPAVRSGVLVDHVVSPFGVATKIAQETATDALRRAGLSDMVEVVVAVLGEIVGDAERSWRGRADTLDERAAIRISVPPGASVLVVEVEETRDISMTPISAGLRAACRGRDRELVRGRAATGSGTRTRCTLTLNSEEVNDVTPDPSTERLGAAVRQFRELNVGHR
ncbi:hypothetical protein [Nocardia fluminea]|uniref:hypothetical protein n=1 Tax=Nocardia fluminea TaxID=134984 RepID=UPI003D11A8F0